MSLARQSTLVVGRRTVVLYGVGSIASGVKDSGFRTLLLFYYNQVLGMSAASVSLAILIALVFDAALDPIIGQWSDMTRSKLGRRHPFMFAAAVPLGLAYALLWRPFPGLGAFDWVRLVVLCVAVRFFISLYEIPSSALVNTLARDYHQRTALLSWRFFFGIGGATMMAYLTYRLLLKADAPMHLGQLGRAGYLTYGVLAGLVMTAAILVSSWGTQAAGRADQPSNAPAGGVRQTARHMLRSLSFRPFVVLVAGAFCAAVGLGLAGSLSLYIDTFLWKLNSEALATLSLTGILGAVSGPFLATTLSKVIGKKWAIILCVLGCVVFAVAPAALRLLGLFPPNGAKALIPLLFLAGSGVGASGVASLTLFSSMMADAADANRVRLGLRSEGLFFAAAGFVQKAMGGVGVFLAGQLLVFAGLDLRVATKRFSPEAMNSLVLLYMAALTIIFGVGLCFLLFYDLDEKQHVMIESKIEGDDTERTPANGAQPLKT